MQVIIYGAGGQLGRALQRVCQTQGLPFQAISRSKAYDLTAHPPIFPMPAVGTTHAVICSSITSMDACFKDPIGTAAVNVYGTCVLIERLLDAGIHPLFCSSDVVFRGDRGAYLETDAVDPVLEYGRQKVQVETWFQQQTPRALSVRMSKLYALDVADPSPVGGTLRALRAGQTVRAAIDQLIVPTRIEDVAEALLALLARDASGTFHLAPEPEGWYTRYTLAMTLAARLGRERQVIPCRLAELPVLEPRPANNTLLVHKAKALLGRALPPLSTYLKALEGG